MKNFFERLLAVMCMSTFFLQLFSQDQCSPVGWATQNGGTTGGGNASPVTVSTLSELQSQAGSSGAKVIYLSGTVGSGVNTRVSVASNKTIIGLPGAKLVGGFDVKANNIIIRNMKVQGPGAVDVDGVDCITIDGASNVWIDHCDLSDGQDGNMDIVNGSNYVSVTWCKFSYTSASSNHQFCNLFGNSDSKTSDRGKLRITLMYNWWAAGCKERMPRVRFGQVHVVNNYYSCTGDNYCVRAAKEADLLVESNYFDAVKTPIDLYENDFTAVTQRNNVFNNTTGNTAGSGTSFTPPYTLIITPAANIKAAVSNPACGAGATMASPTSCGCGSTPTTYTLTTSSNPSAGGTVSGGGTYNSGTVVTVTATPAAGYTFTSWSGDASGTNPTTTVTMNGNKTAIANFQATAPATYTLTTTASPAAGGSVSGAGTYNAGTVVTVTATPAAGYTFTSWSGDASGTNPTTTVTMNGNKTAIANFQATAPATYTLTTSASPAAGGSVSGAGTYNAGTVVTVMATPAAGYSFSSWSGDASGTNPTTTVTMTSNKSATANFQAMGGGTSTIRIEDNATPSTGLCSYEGSISSNSGASNSKVINLTNSTGKGINWKINVPSAGSYSLNWRYTNGSTNNVYSMKLIVNALTVNAALPFPKTSGSSAFLNTVTTVNLAAGNNDIRLESISSTATADIDWIEVTGNAPAAGSCAAARGFSLHNASGREYQAKKAGIFPNPATGKVNIGFELTATDKVSVKVFTANGAVANNLGSKLYTGGYHQLIYDLSGKMKGLYTIVITSQAGNQAFKLIVE